jgi:hypothetical protein
MGARATGKAVTNILLPAKKSTKIYMQMKHPTNMDDLPKFSAFIPNLQGEVQEL